MISSIVTPVVMAIIMEDVAWCAILTFISVFCYWCINYIAAEIEMPFGEDANDLPVARLQESLNQALMMLLDDRCRQAPSFTFNDQALDLGTIPCPFWLITDVQHNMFGEHHHKTKKLEA